MTIPTRPAPAPPGSRAQNAAAGANASIEQFRMQLQEQQKLTIKLPPPPKGPMSSTATTNYSNNNNSGGSSITRKFPQARYAPITNWNDSPFESSSSSFNNGNLKKVPPPRPPPPKVPANTRSSTKQQTTGSAQLSSSLLTNIFQRKKSSKTNANTARSKSTTRVYSVSNSNNSNSNSNGSSSYASFSSNNAANTDWNAVWNSTPSIAISNNSVTASSQHHTGNNSTAAVAAAEAQLICFDSPPSSPTFTQKSNSDCVSVDSFSSDSNFSSPNNGSVSQPESGFEDDFSSLARSRPSTTSPLDPWETLDNFASDSNYISSNSNSIGTAPVRNLNSISTRMQQNNDNPLCNGKSLLPPTASLNMPTIIKPKISQKPKAPKPPPSMGFNTSSAYLKAYSGNASPPMPQCAPPTAPAAISLLDVISGKADALQLANAAAYDIDINTDQPYGIALYNFDGTEEGDLCFKENEKIYLLEQVSEEWFSGRTRAGCVGIFPVNYIDIKVPLSPAVSNSTAANSNAYAAAQSSSVNRAPKVRCLYNFPAEMEGDLALKENEMVAILYKINEDWLFGQTIDGRQGQFPANFLEYVPNNLMSM